MGVNAESAQPKRVDRKNDIPAQTYCVLSLIPLPPSLSFSSSDTLLCEEAIFQFLASPRLASIPLERLLESLPGRRVDWKNVERLKKACSPQQQLLQILRLWREQNKDQDKIFHIIQGAT